ncbi:peptide/nickel transport system permease protein [Sanguibacter gelidistatuariae]|uniref:Peptide/nickel transport system permease protein n=1 Tax=Sanguibacter gelidistatuariae TaxID=1814289 RepID=A0A1G6HE66_9MICO|nr:ABC transporter permease [Sanguibacter gelidistatuariae]SDB92550.1 peptide/nickel transport system permease protein [Sanguibacter gelidistatuariae]
MADEDIRESLIAVQATGAGTADAVAIDESTAVTAPDRASRFIRAVRFVRRSPKFALGAGIVLAIVLFAIFGPMLTQNPKFSGNEALQPPSTDHWLGTTGLGYDMLAQLAYGARGSLIIGVVVAAIAVSLSVLFGVVGGYLGGWTDEILSLITNIMLVIPGLPLIIVISGYMDGRTVWFVAFVLGLTAWAGSAVVLRLQARSLRNRDYVAAARVSGEKAFRIVFVEIMPNLLPLFAAQFLFAMVFAILGEAGLSYLGLGATGSITWGTILNDAQVGMALTRDAWWWFVPPGVLIALVGGGLSLINFSIDEIINPKLRAAPAAVKSVRKARKTVLKDDHAGTAGTTVKVDA